MHTEGSLRPPVRKPARLLCAAACGLALTGSLSAAAPSARPGAVTNFPGTPTAVSVVSATDAWAVEGSNVVLHWNGTTWTQQALPQKAGTVSVLVAVSAISGSDVWAAGTYSGTGASIQHTLIEHWDGTHWTRVPSPSPFSNKVVDLAGVSGSSGSDAWAVGSYYRPSSNSIQNLILHWNGTRWARVPCPNFVQTSGPDNIGLTAVTSLSASDAWAVGAETLHWNGTKWALVTIPAALSGTLRTLEGVSAASPSDIWAAGSDIPKPGSTHGNNVLMRWDGSAWTRVATPQPGSPDGAGSQLSGVAASSPANAWAVGTYEQGPLGPGVNKTLMLHWNGTSWTRS